MPRRFISKSELKSTYMKSGQRFTKKKILVPTLTLVMMMFAFGIGPATPQEALAATVDTHIEMTVEMPELSISKHETNLVKSANQQAQYSNRWETQADGSWKYKLDNGTYATSAWVQDEVDGQWYLLNETGVMRSGIFESYGKYYLLSEVHDGHFGHLVKNGEVYKGITIQADTSTDYEGALSTSTIESLTANGYNFGSVSSVTGTQHVTNGQTTTEDTPTPEPTGNTNNGDMGGLPDPSHYAGQNGGGAIGGNAHWY